METVYHIIAVTHDELQGRSYLYDGAGPEHHRHNYPADSPTNPGIYLARRDSDATWEFTLIGTIPTLEQAIQIASTHATLRGLKIGSPTEMNRQWLNGLVSRLTAHAHEEWERSIVIQCFGFFIANGRYPLYCWEERYTLGMSKAGTAPQWKSGDESPQTSTGRMEIWDTGLMNTSREARDELFAAITKHRSTLVFVKSEPCECGSPVLIAERLCRSCQVSR